MELDREIDVKLRRKMKEHEGMVRFSAIKVSFNKSNRFQFNNEPNIKECVKFYGAA